MENKRITNESLKMGINKMIQTTTYLLLPQNKMCMFG